VAVVVTAMDVGVVIFGTDGGAIGGMRIAAGSGGGAMDVVEIMATKKGRGGFLSSLLTVSKVRGIRGKKS
jgi:hypothetical protein